MSDDRADEPVHPRKPWRRTAWTLVIGGVAATVLMVGVGLLLLAGGQDIGPGRPGTWPAGERASVHKHLGPKESEPVECEVIGADGEPEGWLEWANSVRSSRELTVTCEQDTTFLTGTASAVTSAVQSSLVMTPVMVTLAGILLFFPRFTLALARLSNPRR